ncbi:MAG TPA: carboxypeptidase M32 [Anaerolineales bacterium]|nr:carboxypeptidase M32 [Anaerolineales bacterium]
MTDALRDLKNVLGEVADLRAANSVLSWDEQTYMPPGGAPGRAIVLSTLSRLAHERFVDDRIGELLDHLEPEMSGADLDSDDARLLSVTRRVYEKDRKVPSQWVAEFSLETSLAQQDWQKARATADFTLFRPHLEKIVGLRRQYAGFFAPYDSVYDPLLDDFEPGMKTATVRGIFDALRPQQVELVRAIAAKGNVVDDRPLHKAFDEKKQWDFGMEIIRRFGYDLEHGRQDRSAHPFTTDFWTGDVRITTRLRPKYLPTGMFGSFHEAGHALYGQGIPARFDRTLLASRLSSTVHESQSRTWENLVGRSRAFWKAFYPRLRETFPRQLGEVSLEAFYRAINKVGPSLIRTDADEATYNLHIMLRFELELALMEGSLAVADLPEAWNARMQEYLGITPPHDGDGVLQDIHWSVGAFGYFPTYALGNLLSAQLWEAAEKEIPDLTKRIARKDFSGLLEWLRTRVHQFGGKYEAVELIRRATGHPLSPEAYVRYLRGKFGEIYKL